MKKKQAEENQDNSGVPEERGEVHPAVPPTPPKDVIKPDTTSHLVFWRFSVLYNKHGAAAVVTSAMGNEGNRMARQMRWLEFGEL